MSWDENTKWAQWGTIETTLVLKYKWRVTMGIELSPHDRAVRDRNLYLVFYFIFSAVDFIFLLFYEWNFKLYFGDLNKFYEV